MESSITSDKISLVLKLALFIGLAFAGVLVFPPMLYPTGGLLIAAALGTFSAAVIANTVMLRIFERASLADIGLNWHEGAKRNFWIGMGAGITSAAFVLLLPLLAGAAHFERTPDQPGSVPGALFVLLVLLFGAVGEELLFRGYGFQLLLASQGRFGTILPVSIIFGLVHTSNPGANVLGIVNTIGFGIVLGYAYTQTGDLWLPIGIHFGWNAALPLLGLKLSGFTMGIPGYRLQWDVSDLWSGGAYGPEGSVLTCIVLIALMWFLKRVPVFVQIPYLIAKSLPES